MVGVGVRVAVAVRVEVGVAVVVGVSVGVGVRVWVGVTVAVRVDVLVAVVVGVCVEVGVAVLVAVVVGVRVRVAVAVGVGVGGSLPSYAPISHSIWRATPRWSSNAHALPPLPGKAGLPAQMALLPLSNIWVKVEPPLLANGPISGFSGVPGLPVWSPEPATNVHAKGSWIPIKL